MAIFIVALPHAIFASRNEAYFERKALASGKTKRCPYCSELIKSDALVCPHCQRDLIDFRNLGHHERAQQVSKDSTSKVFRDADPEQ